jgi:hypothetical protein
MRLAAISAITLVALCCSQTSGIAQQETRPVVVSSIMKFAPLRSERLYSPIIPVVIVCSKSCPLDSCLRNCTDTQTCRAYCDPGGNAHCDCN